MTDQPTKYDLGVLHVGRRVLVNYIVVYGQQDGGTYKAHWTGEEWEASSEPNAYVWGEKKYAQECVDEDYKLLLDRLHAYLMSPP